MKVIVLTRNRISRYFVENHKEIREETLSSVFRLLGAPHACPIPVVMIDWVNVIGWRGKNDWQKDYVVDAFNSLWAIGEWDGEDDLYGSFEDCFEWATKGQLV